MHKEQAGLQSEADDESGLAEGFGDSGDDAVERRQVRESGAAPRPGVPCAHTVSYLIYSVPRRRKLPRLRSVLFCSRCRRLSNSPCLAASLERQSTVSAWTRPSRAHDRSNTKQDTSSGSRPRRYTSIHASLSPGPLSDDLSLRRSNVTTTSASLRMLGTPT